MTGNIPIPSSRVGAEMARAINRNRLMSLPGQLVSDGPFGRSFSRTCNRRDRRTASTRQESLSFVFKVRTGTETDESTPPKSRRFIDMLCISGGKCVSYNGTSPSAGKVYGFSPGETCDLSADGWQRLHQTDFSANPPALSESVILYIDQSNPEKPTWNITNVEQKKYPVSVTVATVSGGSVNQIVMGRLAITAPNDEKSIGISEKQKLQLAHFADAEKDSSKGLATRLKVNLETGEITANDDNIMLVCRDKSGQLIYVPLSGSGEDPKPDDPTPSSEDPCDHPGGGSGSDGGVPAGEDHPGAKGEGSGGVKANGDTHTGDGCQGQKCK